MKRLEFKKALKKIGEGRLTYLTSMHSILILTVALVLIASLSMGILVQNYMNMVNREFQEIYRDTADLYVSTINDKITDYQTAIGVVSMSTDLRDNIFRKDVSRSEMVILGRELRQKISEMTFLLYQSHDVISHRLYTYLPSDGYIFWDVNQVENDERFTGLKQGDLQWWYHYSKVTRSNHLILGRVIYNFNSVIGSWGQGYCYQTMEIDTATLFDTNHGLSTRVFLFDNRTNELIYHNIPSVKEEDIASVSAKYKEIIGDTQNGKGKEFPSRIYLREGENRVRFIAIARPITGIDVTAILLFDEKQIKGMGSRAIILGNVFVLMFMMLLLIVSNWMYNRRLSRLIVRMDHFDEKEIRLPKPLGGRDEIAMIDRHLLQMQNRIQILIQEEYTAKMQRMAAHQKALMACINPHFLYNTLNTISAMACIEGADSTVEMVSALSDMFRYSSDLSKQEISLYQEIDHIKDYLYIQSIRYDGAFTYQIIIGEELYSCLVPKLMLQPVVENAFKHGFKNQMTQQGGDRQLQIRANCFESDLILSVTDNGMGMDENKLAELRQKLCSPLTEIAPVDSDIEGIGLINVHQRIQLNYGTDYGLTLISEGEGKGLSVSIRIPKKSGKKGG